MKELDLSFLLKEKIISVQSLHPNYEDHASDVWLVQIEGGEVVVRSSKMMDHPIYFK